MMSMPVGCTGGTRGRRTRRRGGSSCGRSHRGDRFPSPYSTAPFVAARTSSASWRSTEMLRYQRRSCSRASYLLDFRLRSLRFGFELRNLRFKLRFQRRGRRRGLRLSFGSRDGGGFSSSEPGWRWGGGSGGRSVSLTHLLEEGAGVVESRQVRLGTDDGGVLWTFMTGRRRTRFIVTTSNDSSTADTTDASSTTTTTTTGSSSLEHSSNFGHL